MQSEKYTPLAFPILDEPGYYDCGMSLRDWFASQALIAIAKSGEYGEAYANDHARVAYVYADAMLKARY